MKKHRQQLLLNALGIVGIVAGTAILVSLGILNIAASALAAIACYPMAKNVWKIGRVMRINPLRVIRKSLTKIGFSIENTEWNEQHTDVCIHGKYHDELFAIDASEDKAFIMICDMPWLSVKASDPNIPKFLEAINEVNAQHFNMSVVLAEPDENGDRIICTVTKTIIPTYWPEAYLDSLLCEMLNCKADFARAMEKDRPYMKQRRSTVGFNMAQNSENVNDEEKIAPAASNDSDVKN